ncbi:MAG: hypothetical protein C0456_02250 [Hyphomonas sp.]|nr:hypothetical protein [Hyphomonas sp.]
MALCGLIMLGGCATVSFAPPREWADAAGKAKTLDTGLTILGDATNEYSQAANELANGRQLFDVPLFLAAVGGATAVALGANADVAIGVGAVSALSTSGKTYYQPTERAAIYTDAVSAFACMQRETIGLNENWTNGLKLRGLSDASLNNEQRAFELLMSAIYEVEGTVRTRLAQKGSITDAASIAALVGLYQAQIDEAAKKDTAAPSGFVALNANEYRINLEALAPKLSICALRARG